MSYGTKNASAARRMQRGFIDLPRGFFETLTALAFIGVFALAGFAGWALWWLVTHIRFVA